LTLLTVSRSHVSTAGISGVKSREDLVMSNTDLSAADPFGAAPFKPPAGSSATPLEICVDYYYRYML